MEGSDFSLTEARIEVRRVVLKGPGHLPLASHPSRQKTQKVLPPRREDFWCLARGGWWGRERNGGRPFVHLVEGHCVHVAVIEEASGILSSDFEEDREASRAGRHQWGREAADAVCGMGSGCQYGYWGAEVEVMPAEDGSAPVIGKG